MNKLVTKLIGGLVLALNASIAQATLITVDPDSYAPGTDISNAFSGVTLSATLGIGAIEGISGRVFAIDPSDPAFNADPNYVASTGSLAFGHDGTFGGAMAGHVWHGITGVYLRADFAELTSFVSLDFISNNGSDVGELLAFDIGGNLLASYTTAALGLNEFETMSISLGSADIAYILAAGEASGGDTGGLDNLRFRVPEPSTLALLGIGLAGIGLARRRRTQ